MASLNTNGIDIGSQNDEEKENTFQKAIAIWRGIDLISLQKQLDNQASEIITKQRDDLVERKEVAQKTKEFKKLNDADKLTEHKGLLKAYQQFIDHISNNRKATETLFLNVYNQLSEAPDPYPLLDATIDTLVSSEDVSRLNSENSSLQTTIGRLNSQTQALEQRVESLKRENSRKDEEARRALAKAEEGHRAMLEEKTANWDAKERSWQEKVELQEKVMKELKASYEVNIRMGQVNNTTDDEDGIGRRGASKAEFEIISGDLERTTMRLADMESRNEQLRLQLAQATTSSTEASSTSKAADDEMNDRIDNLESTNSTLMKKIDAIRKENEDRIRDSDKKQRQLEREVELAHGECGTLKEKIKTWSNYEDMKRELEILKSIEFSTGDDDEDDEGIESEEASEKKNKKETLEQLLLARNKKLGNELTVLKVSHQDLTDRLTELQNNLRAANQELSSSRNLTAQLEDDLLKVQSQSQLPSSALSVAGTYTSRFNSGASQAGTFAPRGGNRISPTSSIISGRPGQQLGTFESLRANSNDQSTGILPMVTAQRDRFKQRNAALEEELKKSQDTVASLRQEVSSLQKDNLHLYEKTRYISAYSRGNAVSSGPAQRTGIHNNPSTSSGLSIDRYRAAYEANLSPFEAFRGREQARAYNKMGFLERLIFSMTKAIMRNRLTRNLFVGYCFALHLLSFGILYWTGMWEIEKGMTGVGSKVHAGHVVEGGVGNEHDTGHWRKVDYHD